jgi:hypothetical protein
VRMKEGKKKIQRGTKSRKEVKGERTEERMK